MKASAPPHVLLGGTTSATPAAEQHVAYVWQPDIVAWPAIKLISWTRA